MTASPSDPDPAVGLVHQGWNHLQLQRPQAAWASWQRALRVVPGDPAASEALERLETADDLPAAARVVYRFESPGSTEQRDRWNARIAGRDLEDLAEAADLFGRLAGDDPSDAPAWYNRGLCLAWLGRNAEAVSSLDHYVQLQSADRPERAANAWSLAEILRQGGGAESLADDLRFVWVVPWREADTSRLLAECFELQAVPPPLDPLTGERQVPEAQIYEWLDRPLPEPSSTLSAAELPRLLATVVITPRSLRLSSPDPETLERLREDVPWALDDPSRPVRREAAPLPLSLLDAGVWTFRRPSGLEPEHEGRLTREAVEHFYENLWIHLPRQGLGDLSPLEASRVAARGDTVARSRLSAVVRIREQLSARPRVAGLYQGYPFDRLRRRLGLEFEPELVDPSDHSCMSEEELDRLDPNALNDDSLTEAYLSASGLRDDERTARFAARLATLFSLPMARHSRVDMFAVLIREALRAHQPDRALEWVDRARTSAEPRDRRTYDIWGAEIHARTGNPDAALAVYRALLDDAAFDTAELLDAAEHLAVNGHVEHARELLEIATEECRRTDDRTGLARIRGLLGDDERGPEPLHALPPTR